MRRRSQTTAAAMVAALLLLSVAACGTSNAPNDGALVVGATVYPLEELVRQVAGPSVHLVTLVPPGEAAHDFEPTARQLAALEHADVVFYLGHGFQPNLQHLIDALPQHVRRVDLLEGLTLLPPSAPLPGTEGTTDGETLADGNDPHVWLDPHNMQAMAAVVERVLAEARPDLHAAITAGAQAYDGALTALDRDLANGLAHCTSPYLVTGHRAFAYLAARYGLTQVAIAGISPGAEPSAKSLKAVAQFARSHAVSTIFFEENLPHDLARTVAEEIGATTAVLDPLESPSGDQRAAGATYLSLMREDLATIRAGLGCT